MYSHHLSSPGISPESHTIKVNHNRFRVWCIAVVVFLFCGAFYNGYGQGNIFPGAPGKVGIGTNPVPAAQRPLHINAYPLSVIPLSHQDATMRLSFAKTGPTAETAGDEISWGHLTLISPYIALPIQREYSYLAGTADYTFLFPEGKKTIGDLVLSSSDHARHLILATHNPTGHIQLSTTSVLGGPDVARMIINPNGDIFLGKQACNIAAANDPTILFSNYYNNYDVIIGSKLGVGNPAGSSSSCTGTAGSITFFGNAAQSFDVIHNLDGHLRFGTGLIGSSVTDLMTIAPWTGRIGVGYNLNSDERIPGPGNELFANFLVSQTNHTEPNGFGMDEIVMRVERRFPSLPMDPSYTLISAGDGANVESFSVLSDGTIKSTTLAGAGVRPLYADASGNITTSGTPPPEGWTLTGNTGTTSANYIGTNDNQPLIFKTNNSKRLELSSGGEFSFFGSQSTATVTFTADGKMGIGTTSPGSLLDIKAPATGTRIAVFRILNNSGDEQFKISHDGFVLAQEYKIALQSGTDWTWPDYVLRKEYNLMPLNEVEEYINDNGHLPGMPSAKQVEQDGGVEVGKIQAKLLEKIEELTLHLIELKKENEEIKKQLQMSQEHR